MTIIEQIKAEIERRIALYSSLSENTVNPNRIDEDRQILSFLSTLEESERPEPYNPVYDEAYLNEKIKKATESWKGVDVDAMLAEFRGYDEEKSEKPMNQDGLGEEIQRFLSNATKMDNGKWRGKYPISEMGFSVVARHFAQWGAEHFRDLTKKMGDSSEIPADLEEAAWDCVLDNIDVNNPVLLPKYKELLTYLFIAGAKWDREQMMSNAVEGRIFMSFAPGHNQMVMADVDLPTNTKVRVIIIKEDEK